MTGLQLGPGAGPVGPALLGVGLLGVLAVSPLLAGWSAALSAGVKRGWWRPRRVSISRWAVVAVAGAALVAVTAAGRPWPAWLLLAAVGAVLVVVDAQHHLLPARLVYPLAAAETLLLVIVAVLDGQTDRLLRAVVAAAVVAAVWLLIIVAAPSAVGLGDVRLFVLTAGLLGWTGWWAVLYGELVAFVIAVLTAAALALVSPRHRGRGTPVPMGPAILLGAALVCWL